MTDVSININVNQQPIISQDGTIILLPIDDHKIVIGVPTTMYSKIQVGCLMYDVGIQPTMVGSGEINITSVNVTADGSRIIVGLSNDDRSCIQVFDVDFDLSDQTMIKELSNDGPSTLLTEPSYTIQQPIDIDWVIGYSLSISTMGEYILSVNEKTNDIIIFKFNNSGYGPYRVITGNSIGYKSIAIPSKLIERDKLLCLCSRSNKEYDICVYNLDNDGLIVSNKFEYIDELDTVSVTPMYIDYASDESTVFLYTNTINDYNFKLYKYRLGEKSLYENSELSLIELDRQIINYPNIQSVYNTFDNQYNLYANQTMSVVKSANGNIMAIRSYMRVNGSTPEWYIRVYKWNGIQYILSDTISSSDYSETVIANMVLSADGHRLIAGSPESQLPSSNFYHSGCVLVFNVDDSGKVIHECSFGGDNHYRLMQFGTTLNFNADETELHIGICSELQYRRHKRFVGYQVFIKNALSGEYTYKDSVFYNDIDPVLPETPRVGLEASSNGRYTISIVNTLQYKLSIIYHNGNELVDLGYILLDNTHGEVCGININGNDIITILYLDNGNVTVVSYELSNGTNIVQYESFKEAFSLKTINEVNLQKVRSVYTNQGEFLNATDGWVDQTDGGTFDLNDVGIKQITSTDSTQLTRVYKKINDISRTVDELLIICDCEIISGDIDPKIYLEYNNVFYGMSSTIYHNGKMYVYLDSDNYQISRNNDSSRFADKSCLDSINFMLHVHGEGSAKFSNFELYISPTIGDILFDGVTLSPDIFDYKSDKVPNRQEILKKVQVIDGYTFNFYHSTLEVIHPNKDVTVTPITFDTDQSIDSCFVELEDNKIFFINGDGVKTEIGYLDGTNFDTIDYNDIIKTEDHFIASDVDDNVSILKDGEWSPATKDFGGKLFYE